MYTDGREQVKMATRKVTHDGHKESDTMATRKVTHDGHMESDTRWPHGNRKNETNGSCMDRGAIATLTQVPDDDHTDTSTR